MRYICSVGKKHISALIVIMTVALIGLMGIQVYWIGDAVKVKEATFIRDVNLAMNNVMVKVEKVRMQQNFEQKMNLMNRRANLMATWDSINYSMQQELNSPMSGEAYNDFLRRYSDAQQLIQNMIYGLGTGPSDEPGTSPRLLDSLIQEELGRQGIKISFEFGIYNPRKNAMEFQKTGRYPQQLLTESFVFDMQEGPSPMRFANQLLLFFPNEKRFLVSQLWDLMLISALLILIIIVSFGSTIFTIFRQKKLSEIKNDFVNNMTHEFKTPISTIGLACEALRDRDIQKTEGLYSTYISMIDEENKRLGSMAEQILQSAVMDKGELVLQLENIDLHEVINESVASKSLQAKKKDGQISAELQAERTIIRGDRVHMTNVVLNLLDNALKYTEGVPDIAVRSRSIPNAIEFSVQDNGIGISKQNQKRIFEKLYRVPTGNIHNVKGFGLGLSYVKAIVEKHGGTVHLDSEPKKGSTFYIRLPLNRHN
ncbi:MAG: HAMP domain-containing histidine kinase [Bacteroidetes bacterium]|nr:HAMP domain-containing histidine kinase [Bacteroidota bacterium]